MGRWKEGLLFQGINPTPGLASAANWFPRTEEVGPDELRITFMGTAPFIRPGQMNTSIFIELGNGDNFVFDIGEGSVANYISAGLALNQLDKIATWDMSATTAAVPWSWPRCRPATGWRRGGQCCLDSGPLIRTCPGEPSARPPLSAFPSFPPR